MPLSRTQPWRTSMFASRKSALDVVGNELNYDIDIFCEAQITVYAHCQPANHDVADPRIIQGSGKSFETR
jgi:hypothetical protein